MMIHNKKQKSAAELRKILRFHVVPVRSYNQAITQGSPSLFATCRGAASPHDEAPRDGRPMLIGATDQQHGLAACLE